MRKSLIAVACLLLLPLAACGDSESKAKSGVDLQTAKDGAEMVVVAGYICSEYMKKPQIAVDAQNRMRGPLTDAGLSVSEANAFMNERIEASKSETNTETQSQIACEMVGVKALPVN